ncbi:uncharacterized protein LOC126982417 [Eriocheir sinensis]|uniref:uncharacterized protein LOC126982417 n=1 Tax=Eriocheir sinensis TaxID=95602 RepID=UPI0021C5EFEA|nr:uncharacterized protein LOC126982417 [Eriocheir sinensis]
MMETDPILLVKKAAMKDAENTEPRQEKMCRYAKQIFIVLLASLPNLFMGVTFTWPNVLRAHLATDNTTLFGAELHLSEWDFDMINSLVCIGSVFGLLLSGWLFQRISRKKSLIVAMVPGLVGWATLGLAVNTPMLLFGRLCDGMTTGMTTQIVVTYAVEIPDTAIRGTACSTTTILFLFGTALSVILSLAMTWYAVALSNVGAVLVYICLIVPFLPESPTFLIVTEKEKEATKVLRKLRGNYSNIKTEMALIKNMNDEVAGDKGWSFILQREMQKKFLVLTILSLVQGFCGTEVLRPNVLKILEMSGVTGSTDLFVIILILVPISGAFVMSCIIDRLGRRGCLVLSLAFTMIAYVVLGSTIFVQTLPLTSVVPIEFNDTAKQPPYQVELSDDTRQLTIIISLIVCIFGMNIGIQSLPFQLASEYFPTTIRSQAMSLNLIVGYAINAIPLTLYSAMNNLLTTAGLFYFFAAVSGIGVVFTLLCVQETALMLVG